jgi:hypothetical protein
MASSVVVDGSSKEAASGGAALVLTSRWAR